MTYKQGHGARGKGEWEPVLEVIDILDTAFYTAFDTVKPSGKRWVLALDVSDSMDSGEIAGVPGLTPRVGSAAMAMVTYKVEASVEIIAFSTKLMRVDLSRQKRLDDVVKAVDGLPFGGTDCAQPMLWAMENKVKADVFVLAVPLEASMSLVTDALAKVSPVFSELRALDVDRITSWMTGAQFYLSEDIPLVEGHVFFPSTPWALTAISQAQFWNRGARSMKTFGDGRLKGILSVDISNCHVPDEDGVCLVDVTSREGILQRTLKQLVQSLDASTGALLERSVYAAHLDDELKVGPGGVQNSARLLIHPPGSRFARPIADSGLENLFLAGDYVRTEVDLASMEGANESGRRAALCAMNRVDLDASHVRFFEHEPLKRFAALRKVDELAWRLGKPHPFDLARSVMAAR